tara:strand:+ start:1473 stop:1655 length:183 start_codon:yes stop_codon:yes gene_type:complete
MKYHVYLCEGCTPKIKSFKTESELYKFVAEFLMEGYDNPDNFIDLIFKGKLLQVDKRIKE